LCGLNCTQSSHQQIAKVYTEHSPSSEHKWDLMSILQGSPPSVLYFVKPLLPSYSHAVRIIITFWVPTFWGDLSLLLMVAIIHDVWCRAPFPLSHSQRGSYLLYLLTSLTVLVSFI